MLTLVILAMFAVAVVLRLYYQDQDDSRCCKGRLIRWFSDPAIGFPRWGDEGRAVVINRLDDRGFGIQIHRETYTRPTLRLSLWWTWELEWHTWCPRGEE